MTTATTTYPPKRKFRLWWLLLAAFLMVIATILVSLEMRAWRWDRIVAKLSDEEREDFAFQESSWSQWFEQIGASRWANGFRTITHVYVDTYVDDAWLSDVCAQGDLTTFWASHANFSPQGLAQLAEQTNMVNLVLEQDSLTPDHLEQIRRMHALESLGLTGRGVDDAGLKHFSKLHHIMELAFERTSIQGAGLASLPKARLELFSVSNSPFDDAGVRSLAAFANLDYARFEHVPVSDEGLKNLNAKLIRRLHIIDTQVTGEFLHGFNSVYWLDVSGSPIDDSGLKIIGKLPGLALLGLHRTNVTPQGFAALCHSPKLGMLCLESNAITTESMTHIAKIKELQFIELSGSIAKDQLAEMRKQFPHIEWRVQSGAVEP